MDLSPDQEARLAELLSTDVREELQLGANWNSASENDLNTNNPLHCKSLSDALVRYLNTGEESPLIFQGTAEERLGGIFGANIFLVRAIDRLHELQASDAPESEATGLACLLQLQPERLHRLDLIIP